MTPEQVKEICQPCYENMLKQNISRIKKKYLLEKLESAGMTLYEVVFKGEPNMKFNLGVHELLPYEPRYFEPVELPFTFSEIEAMPNISITKMKVEQRPQPKELQVRKAKIKGTRGVVWVGSSPRRSNEYGTFVKDEVVWDLPNDVIDKLAKMSSSFKIVS